MKLKFISSIFILALMTQNLFGMQKFNPTTRVKRKPADSLQVNKRMKHEIIKLSDTEYVVFIRDESENTKKCFLGKFNTEQQNLKNAPTEYISNNLKEKVETEYISNEHITSNIEVSRDKKNLILGLYGEIRVINIETGSHIKYVSSDREDEGNIVEIITLPHSDIFITVSYNFHIRVWQINIDELSCIKDLAYSKKDELIWLKDSGLSPSKKYFICFYGDGQLIIWNTETWESEPINTKMCDPEPEENKEEEEIDRIHDNIYTDSRSPYLIVYNYPEIQFFIDFKTRLGSRKIDIGGIPDSLGFSSDGKHFIVKKGRSSVRYYPEEMLI